MMLVFFTVCATPVTTSSVTLFCLHVALPITRDAHGGDFEVIGVALDLDCGQPQRGRSDGCGAGATEGIDNGLRGIKLGDAPFHETDGFLGRVNLAAIHPLWPHPTAARHSVNVCPSHLKISAIAVVVR